MKDKLKDFLENNKSLAWLIFIAYVVLLCFVSYYHEPWHDEGQAWLIARDDSLWRLITVTTHLEGHPPLWHILLMPFAKLGVPFELGLKSINIACISLAMWLLVFQSRLPWFLRFSLPFSYFFFYQYGVVNRVYSLLTLGMMLSAYYYSKRHTKPYHLALSLALVSGSQAYGMMIACGIALVWLAELLKQAYEEKISIFTLSKKSREIHALLLLFMLALFFGLTILPRSDTAFFANNQQKGFWQNLFYNVFIAPGQILFSNDMKDNFSDKIATYFFTTLKNYWDMIPSTGIYGALLFIQAVVSYGYGAILQLGFVYVSYKENKLGLYLVPVFLYSILASLVFWNMYHLGILVCLCVFVLWQLCADVPALARMRQDFAKNFSSSKEYDLVKVGLCCCLLAILGINFYWSCSASVHDIKNAADVSRNVAEFIKENELTSTTIWVPEVEKEVNGITTVTTGNLAVNCYFAKNIFQNLDGGHTGHAYHEYRLLNKDDYLASVKKFGPPDFVILGNEKYIKISETFGETITYVPIKKFDYYKIWKDSLIPGLAKLYMRKDLLPKYPQFTPLQDDDKTKK